MAGEKLKEYPSFWIPQLNPTAEVKIEKPVSLSFALFSWEFLEISGDIQIWKNSNLFVIQIYKMLALYSIFFQWH